jgi:hypothetical protein
VRAGPGGPGQPRVVSAEDSVLLPAGLTKLLENAGFDVAATAGEASGCLPRWSVNNQRGPELITQRHSAEVRRADGSLCTQITAVCARRLRGTWSRAAVPGCPRLSDFGI